jgi:hypothetical protein
MPNVKEIWGMKDTVLIGTGMSALARGWFENFAAMAQANEVPFFNIRNRSLVGPQYNNQDSAEMLPYPYQVFSMGIDFFTFAIGDSCLGPAPTPPAGPAAPEEGPQRAPAGPHIEAESQNQNIAERQLFAGLMDHCAAKFKVNQDIKLTNVVTHQPSGFGCSGQSRNGGAGVNTLGALSNYTNGRCHIDNRYKFTVPIDMPRGVNFNVTLFFSQYAKYVLQALKGPQTWYNQATGIRGETTLQPQNSVAGISVTLIGAREVQQRGELHV